MKTESSLSAVPSSPAANLAPSVNRLWYGLWLLCCVLIAFGLRTYRLDLQSFWYDEGVTAEIARLPLPELIQWTAQDIQPPLYYMAVSGWGKTLQGLASSTDPADEQRLKTEPVPIDERTSIPERWGGAWSEWSLRYLSGLFGVLTVPLLAALTAGLSKQRLAGAIAGLLAALHPLLFYYSQEARMYALLTFLAVLAGYLLLCCCGRELGGWRWWGLYVLVATAAVYTHYFAFFLLGTLALIFLLRHFLETEPPASSAKHHPIRDLLLAYIAILLLYLPWFAALFFQLREDTSYWQGNFKVDEALLNVLISFVGGETVTEAVGQQWLLPLGLLMLITILATIWPERNTAHSSHQAPRTNSFDPTILLVSLLWWILPVAAILILALFVPKFNARYVMLGLPGLLILWSSGLARLISPLLKTPPHPRSVVSRYGLPFLGLLLLLMTLSLFGYADRNTFADPEFTKTQWGPLANYVSKRAKPGDAVILTSGHAWPIWDYYAPDVPARGLPEMRILDVNNVLDYQRAARELHELLLGTERAWLISWQDEVVDPMDLVPIFLERAAVEVPRERNYWDIDVRRFKDVDASKVTAELGQPISLNFGNQLILRGYEIHTTGELLLYWQRHPNYQPPASDLALRLSGQLRTDDGLVYADFENQPLTVHEWPIARWLPEQIAVTKVPAAAWAGLGAMPGRYELRLSLYDPAGDLAGYNLVGADGALLGKRGLLPLTLAQPIAGQPVTSLEMSTEIWPNLYLRSETERSEAEVGEPFTLTLDWLATTGISATAPAASRLQIAWQNAAGDVVAQERVSLANSFPIAEWPIGKQLRTLHKIRSPNDLPPGAYTVMMSLATNDSPAVASRLSPALLPFHLLPSSRNFQLPVIETHIDAEFGGQITLRGLEKAVQIHSDADSLTIDLVWQTATVPQRDYSVTVQILNDDGFPVSQSDLVLPGGSSNWLPSQVEVQSVTLSTPQLDAGFQIIVALYDAGTDGFPRLLLPNGADFVNLP